MPLLATKNEPAEAARAMGTEGGFFSGAVAPTDLTT